MCRKLYANDSSFKGTAFKRSVLWKKVFLKICYRKTRMLEFLFNKVAGLKT